MFCEGSCAKGVKKMYIICRGLTRGVAMENFLCLIQAIICVFGGLLFWDVITKFLSDDDDPKAQSYFYSFFKDKSK